MTIEESEAASDARAAAWAQLGLLWVQNSTRSSEASDTAREAERSRDRMIQLGDVEGAQRAELVAAGGLSAIGRAGEGGARAQAVLDAVDSSSSLAGQARLQRARSAVWGPLPAAEVLQLVEGEVAGGAVARARMLALQGRLAEAQVVVAQASQSLAELGDRLGLSSCYEVASLVARLSGDIGEAVRNLQLSYDEQIALGDQSFASTRAGLLAEAYLEAQELDQAWLYAGIARDTSASDDIASQSLGRQIQARVLSARGQQAEAEALAQEAVAIMGRTDYLQMHGDALVHLGHVLHAAGKTDEAVAAAREAVELYDRKGATFLVERTTNIIREWDAEVG